MTYFFNFILDNAYTINTTILLVLVIMIFVLFNRICKLETRLDYLEENIDTWGAEQLKHSTYIKTLKFDVERLENKIEILETQNKDLQTPPCLTITDLNKTVVKKRRNGKISITVPTV